jgi:hypothetical protein
MLMEKNMSDENDFLQWLFYCPKRLSEIWPIAEFFFMAEGFFYLCIFNGKTPRYQYFYEILWNLKKQYEKAENMQFLWTQIMLFDMEELDDIFFFPIIEKNILDSPKDSCVDNDLATFSF